MVSLLNFNHRFMIFGFEAAMPYDNCIMNFKISGTCTFNLKSDTRKVNTCICLFLKKLKYENIKG